MKKYSKERIAEQLAKKKKDYNYDLHTQAIDDLVTANTENSPEISQTEINKYKRDKLSKIPAWIKAIFIKYWFNGAVYFFIVWGLGMFITDFLDQIVVFALAMGMVTDLLINNILRFFDQDGEYERWIVFNKRNLLMFFLNIIYAFILYYLVSAVYTGINAIIIEIFSLESSKVSIGGEPFLFALMYLLFDLAVIGVKEFVKKLIYDANKKLTVQDKEKEKSE